MYVYTPTTHTSLSQQIKLLRIIIKEILTISAYIPYLTWFSFTN